MIGLHALHGRQRDELLADAVHQKARLVLTCKGSEGWETHKSRLLDMAPARRALVVTHPCETEGETFELACGEQVGVAFRHHSRKCLFATSVVGKRQPRRHATRSSGPRALLLGWPEQIEELQRRVYYRVAIPAASPIDVRVWSGGLSSSTQGSPPESKAVTGRLLDLSVGGMCVAIAQADDPHFHTNAVVGAEFRPETGRSSLTLEACYRHVQPLGRDRLSLGFQFIGLEVSSDGASLLARLAQVVSRLQRDQGRWRD